MEDRKNETNTFFKIIKPYDLYDEHINEKQSCYEMLYAHENYVALKANNGNIILMSWKNVIDDLSL